MKYLHHITLTTGHERRAYRHECDDSLLAELAAVVAECDTAGTVEFPSPTGLMQLDRIIESDRPSKHVRIWTIRQPQGPPLVTIVVAADDRSGAGVWRTLHAADSTLATRADQRPGAPWLAVMLHAPVVGHPALAWLGDAERCIAWAWIESDR